MGNSASRILFLLAFLLWSLGVRAADDGIVVQPPKYFDERSLTIMLDDLERQLRAVQVIDQEKLEAQLGVSSGMSRRAFGMSFSAFGPALPGIVTKSTLTADGSLAPSERTVTVPATTGAAPSLPSPGPTLSGPVPGVSADSMLTEQINLTYRLFALRTLLNRSITDRLHVKDKKFGARRQVLLGFSIDIQPPKESKEKEAYVRIELTQKGTSPPYVVSLLPQEKVFNVAAISERSTNFGFALPLSVVSLGAAFGGQKQALYVYRDADTIGRLDPPGQIEENAPTTAFGWTFRPVLGRNFVEPGSRKVFVTLSLDANEDPVRADELSFRVFTGWRKLSESMSIDDPRRAAQLSASGTIDIPSDKDVRKALAPEVTLARVTPLTKESALVTFEGKNFFPGTRVIVGETIAEESSAAMSIPTNEAMTFAARLSDLESGFATVYGRYGLPQTVQVPPKDATDRLQFRLAVQAEPDPARDMVPIKVGIEECKVREPRSDCVQPKWLRDDTRAHVLLVTAGKVHWLINGSVLYEGCVTLPGEEKRCYMYADLEIPKESLAKEQSFTVSIPFAGVAYRDTQPLYPPLSFGKLVKMGSSTESDYWLIQATGLNEKVIPLIKIQVGAYTLTAQCSADRGCQTGFVVTPMGTTALHLTTPNKFLETQKQIAVSYGDTPPYVIAVPPAPKAEPSLVSSKPAEVSKDFGGTVEFAGTSLDAVKRVVFAGKPLDFQVSKDAAKLTVFVSPAVTAIPGLKALAAVGESGTLFSLNIEVKAAVAAGAR